MAHHLFIRSSQSDRYRTLIEQGRPRDLVIVPDLTAEVDILFGEPDRIKDLLADVPALKWVQATWAGVEPLLAPGRRRDYILTNARGVFGSLMSEFVFGYLLAFERKILERDAAQKAGRWDSRLTGWLRGKSLGLLGVGSIGSELARTAHFFGMHVRGVTRATESCPHVERYFHAPEWTEFGAGLDYLVSILPNTRDTQRIVGAALLNSLPPHCIFINAGRGSAVDPAALIEALERGRLRAAVLDVFEQEPLPPDHPFWTTPNLTMTFHTAAPSLPEDLAALFLENYRLFAEGRPLKYRVDFDRGY